MDDLAESLGLSFNISTVKNDPTAVHPRFNSYKNKGKGIDSQKERVKVALELAKIRRLEYVNEIRNLTNDVDEIQSDVKKTRMKKRFGDSLMFSEWMVDIPTDLEQNYSMVLCPVGRRCLVVATHGYTVSYDKAGLIMHSFQSALSGGRRNSTWSSSHSTVLDCIYDQVSRTYYVIDMMSYNGRHICECETEFRWFMLETKFKEEMSEAATVSNLNRNSFILAPRFDCKKDSFDVFSKEMSFEVDGVLFYHNKYPYIYGFSPVTTWLKPYMLPELMGVEVHQSYLTKIPSWYSGFSDYMKSVQEKKDKRKQKRLPAKRGPNNEKMDEVIEPDSMDV